MGTTTDTDNGLTENLDDVMDPPNMNPTIDDNVDFKFTKGTYHLQLKATESIQNKKLWMEIRPKDWMPINVQSIDSLKGEIAIVSDEKVISKSLDSNLKVDWQMEDAMPRQLIVRDSQQIYLFHPLNPNPDSIYIDSLEVVSFIPVKGALKLPDNSANALIYLRGTNLWKHINHPSEGFDFGLLPENLPQFKVIWLPKEPGFKRYLLVITGYPVLPQMILSKKNHNFQFQAIV